MSTWKTLGRMSPASLLPVPLLSTSALNSTTTNSGSGSESWLSRSPNLKYTSVPVVKESGSSVVLLLLPILASGRVQGKTAAAGLAASAEVPESVQPETAGMLPRALEVMPAPSVTKAMRLLPSSKKVSPVGSKSWSWKFGLLPSGT